jgi:hypothetical protein
MQWKTTCNKTNTASSSGMWQNTIIINLKKFKTNAEKICAVFLNVNNS